jgi:hypothetical protein
MGGIFQPATVEFLPIAQSAKEIQKDGIHLKCTRVGCKGVRSQKGLVCRQPKKVFFNFPWSSAANFPVCLFEPWTTENRQMEFIEMIVFQPSHSTVPFSPPLTSAVDVLEIHMSL